MANLTITPASVIPSIGADYLDALAYETIAQGAPVALVDPPVVGTAQSSVRLADATLQYKVIGIAANGASAGQPVKVILRDPALALGVTVAGDVVLLGATNGLTVTPADITTGKYVAVVGVGIGGGKINMGGTFATGKLVGPVRADVPK